MQTKNKQNMKFSWKNSAKTSNFSKNIFSTPKPPKDRPNYPKISSVGEIDFIQLTPEMPKIPRFNKGGSISVSQPTIFMAGDSKIPTEGSKERVTVEKAPNQMVASTNSLTISQEKFGNMGAFKRDCPPSPTSMSTNAGSGGQNMSGRGGTVIIKGLSTFEKVAMETSFLPIWRSFNA
jgi:hypothetical protein